MNDDHDMTRHLPNAEAMPADFEQTEALPTLVGGVSNRLLPSRRRCRSSRHRRCRLPRQRRCR